MILPFNKEPCSVGCKETQILLSWRIQPEVNGNMDQPPLRLVAHHVLQHYPFGAHHLTALGNHGGFTGARLWRLQGDGGAFCLRAWPASDPSQDRLRWIHNLMGRARDEGLQFVPAICRTRDGQTFVESAGRLWELTTWMPGQADFHSRASLPRLESACEALARLHNAWERIDARLGPCPAIERRLSRAAQWRALVKSGWSPSFSGAGREIFRDVAEQAWRLLRSWADRVPTALAPWSGKSFALQPCLCDIWHDHVLFDRDSVRGVIDFGSVKIDHVCVDLARLLGSLVSDDSERRKIGIVGYRRHRRLTDEEGRLVDVLDQTGAIIALEAWLRWVYLEQKPLEAPHLAAERLGGLVQRVEQWQRD